jgi:5'-nucleotidase
MKAKRPHILITNDDGIHAPGIRHLWQALSPYAELTIVAPHGEQSAVGLMTTLRHPLRIDRVRWQSDKDDIWSVTGTPADCVKLALNAIMDKRPDLVVSGINRGANFGRGVLYSGTVAAAIESVMQGIPAIAFSCYDYHLEPEYEGSGKYVFPIVEHILKHPLPEGSLLNVNFPEKRLWPIKGFKMTLLGKEWWAEDPEKRTHPSEGNHYYWLGSKLRNADDTLDGEAAWLRQGYVTAVPLHVADLTDHKHLKSHGPKFEGLFSKLK